MLVIAAEYVHRELKDKWNPGAHIYYVTDGAPGSSGPVDAIIREFYLDGGENLTVSFDCKSSSNKDIQMERVRGLLAHSDFEEFQVRDNLNSSGFSIHIRDIDVASFFKALKVLSTTVPLGKGDHVYGVLSDAAAVYIADKELSRITNDHRLSDLNLVRIDGEVMSDERTRDHTYDVPSVYISVNFSGTDLDGLVPIGSIVQNSYPAGYEDSDEFYAQPAVAIHLSDLSRGGELERGLNEHGLRFETSNAFDFYEVRNAKLVDVAPVLAELGLIPHALSEEVALKSAELDGIAAERGKALMARSEVSADLNAGLDNG
ncbi:hypothetical protein N9Z27_02100 [Alphaproteobacteria bacterium]|nr:hypothetical protein [Alphaproteobacteria bacterium]